MFESERTLAEARRAVTMAARDRGWNQPPHPTLISPTATQPQPHHQPHRLHSFTRHVSPWKAPPHFTQKPPQEQLEIWLDYRAAQFDTPNKPQRTYIARLLLDSGLTYADVYDLAVHTYKWNTASERYDLFHFNHISIPSLSHKAHKRFPPPPTRATNTSLEIVHINAGHTLWATLQVLQQGRFLTALCCHAAEPLRAYTTSPPTTTANTTASSQRHEALPLSPNTAQFTDGATKNNGLQPFPFPFHTPGSTPYVPGPSLISQTANFSSHTPQTDLPPDRCYSGSIMNNAVQLFPSPPIRQGLHPTCLGLCADRQLFQPRTASRSTTLFPSPSIRPGLHPTG